jgi:transporter family-2 protein
MSKGVAIICVLAAGWLIGLQPAANSALSRHVGDLQGAFVSIMISVALIAVVMLVLGHPGQLSGLRSIRPEETLGGIGGAIVVTVGLIAVRPLGAAAVIALFVAAQLVASVLADQFGWFGVHHVGIGVGRVVGLMLVFGGTLLVTR